jgi:hypothetical protein
MMYMSCGIRQFREMLMVYVATIHSDGHLVVFPALSPLNS